MSSERALLEARGLGFSYPDGTQALHDVTLAVRPGERVGLVGPNGAGKSTLLLRMLGLSEGEGELTFDGLTVDRRRLKELRRRVGVVFQDPDDQLFMGSVRDDVAFGLLARGVPRPEVARRVDEVLATLGLADVAARPPHHLSVGQKRGAALASVLVTRPELLALDEPSANLDPRGRRQLLRWLEGFEGALLLASHDLELVLALCPRVVLLDGGCVVRDGPAAQLLADRALMEEHGLEVPPSLALSSPRERPTRS